MLLMLTASDTTRAGRIGPTRFGRSLYHSEVQDVLSPSLSPSVCVCVSIYLSVCVFSLNVTMISADEEPSAVGHQSTQSNRILHQSANEDAVSKPRESCRVDSVVEEVMSVLREKKRRKNAQEYTHKHAT